MAMGKKEERHGKEPSRADHMPTCKDVLEDSDNELEEEVTTLAGDMGRNRAVPTTDAIGRDPSGDYPAPRGWISPSLHIMHKGPLEFPVASLRQHNCARGKSDRDVAAGPCLDRGRRPAL